MNWKPEQIILTRLLWELKGATRVALGPGIPQLARPHLDGVEVIDLSLPQASPVQVDAAVVEAREISNSGDLLLSDEIKLQGVQSGRWLVATRHRSPDGRSRLVGRCSEPAQLEEKARTVITELAVVEISEVGFELKELAPGISSDDVRSSVDASLHVADDIRTMAL